MNIIILAIKRKNRRYLRRLRAGLGRRIVAAITAFSILFQSLLPAYAQSIEVDQAAPASERPGLDTAPNGVPIVNITAPNGAGVSVNKFSNFNVGANGVVMNNSQVAGQSAIGGAILGNDRLAAAGREAAVDDVA